MTQNVKIYLDIEGDFSLEECDRIAIWLQIKLDLRRLRGVNYPPMYGGTRPFPHE